MITIKSKSRLREENGKVYYKGKWYLIIVEADLSSDAEYRYEYMVANY